MTEDRLRAYYASWGTGSPEQVASFFSEDSVFEDLALEVRFEGLAGVKEFAKLTYGGVPDFHVQPIHVLVSGSSAAAAWEMSGTQSGDLLNLPATGNRFRVRASSIILTEGETILQIVDYWNPINLQKQVGLV